jgi:glycerol uptake operon antiterminator
VLLRRSRIRHASRSRFESNRAISKTAGTNVERTQGSRRRADRNIAAAGSVRTTSGDRMRELLALWPIIPAVRDPRELERSLTARGAIVYLLCGTVVSVAELVQRVKVAGKAAIVNLDLIAGLSKDASAVSYLAACGVTGIISTHHETLRAAKSSELVAIQRSFLLDSHALANAARTVERVRPDAVELLPALAAPRAVAAIERAAPGVTLIAGGLIESMQEIDQLLRAGIAGVSVSDTSLWAL